MQSFGISANLARTKTSGPAKKVKILKVFVRIRAFLKHAQWLATGWSLCEEMADEVGAHQKFGQLRAKDCTLCSSFGNVASSNRAFTDEARWQLVSAAVAWCVSLLERALGTHHFAIPARHWVDGPHLLILHMIGHSECKCCGLKTTIAHFLRANQGRADPVDECQVMARVVQEQALNLMSFPPAGPAAKRLRVATTADPSFDFPCAWIAQKLMTSPLSKSPTKLSTGNREPCALFNSYLVKMQKSNPWRPPLTNLVMSKFAMAMVKPLSRNSQGNSDSG